MSLSNGAPGGGTEPEKAAPNPAETSHPLMILAIDDDPGILKFYEKVITAQGDQFESSTDPRQTLDLVATLDPSLVILDLTMPGINGMELLHHVKTRDPNTRVAMITGNYTIDTALMAIRDGAIDYICKPVSVDKLMELVSKVRNLVAQENRTHALERQLAEVSNLEGVIGRSPRMLQVFDALQRLAPHFRTALLAGGPGSGKTRVARALHKLSPGKGQPFVALQTTESNDYGTRPVARFDGVVTETELFQTCLHCTVFIHEVGNLSVSAQHLLFQLLENLAAHDEESAPGAEDSLRIIASTSRDLQAESDAGEFRPDLWQRLSTVQVYVPALRERPEDILLLARHFLVEAGIQQGKPVHRLSRGAEAALAAYPWPGNVAELESVITKACSAEEGNVLDCGDLPAGVVLPGYGDDFLVYGGRGLGAVTGAKGSSAETLRQQVRGIIER